MQKAIHILIDKMRKQLGDMELNDNTSTSNVENTTPNVSIPSQESSVTYHATSIRSPYQSEKICHASKCRLFRAKGYFANVL
jgi:hypothetical protein